MIRNIILAIVAVVVVLIAVLVTFPLIGGDGTEPVDPNNPGLDAVLVQTLEVLYTDGTTQVLDQNSPLTVIQNGKEVDKYYHKIYCTFTGGGTTLLLSANEANSEVTIKTLSGTTLDSYTQSGSGISKNIAVGESNILLTTNSVHATYLDSLAEGTYKLFVKFDMGNSFTYTLDGGTPTNIAISESVSCTYSVLDPSVDYATIFSFDIGIGQYTGGDYYANIRTNTPFIDEEGTVTYGIAGDTTVEATIDYGGQTYVRTQQFDADIGWFGLCTWHDNVLFEIPVTSSAPLSATVSFDIRVNGVPAEINFVN